MLLSKETSDGKTAILLGVMRPGPFGLNYMLYNVAVVEPDGTQHAVCEGLSFREADSLYEAL